MGVAPTVAMGPLADGSISNFACSISNYLCTNFGAFIKKCTIDQLIRSTIQQILMDSVITYIWRRKSQIIATSIVRHDIKFKAVVLLIQHVLHKQQSFIKVECNPSYISYLSVILYLLL